LNHTNDGDELAPEDLRLAETKYTDAYCAEREK
jgi:hypothetical protein